MRKTKHFVYLWYSVVATVHENGCSVEYKIYQITDRNDDGILYYTDNNTDITKEEPEFSGFVKWDGCSNWQSNPSCMIHFCKRKNIEDFHKVMLACFDWTKELIPETWSE